MNEIALEARALMARGIYKGVVIAAAYGKALPKMEDTMLVEGAGEMQLGRLVKFLLTAYLKEVPEEQREMMARWMATQAISDAKKL